MNNKVVRSPWIIGNLSLRPGSIVQISIVAYQHTIGIPARFYAGLIPAIEIAKQIGFLGIKSVIRIIDPTPIASYCNDWEQNSSQFQQTVSDFFNVSGLEFFFDAAEQVQGESLKLLQALGLELESSKDFKVASVIERIKASGKKHGGESGAKNSLLYMAAHPFSWLDMYHSLIWRKKYSREGYQFVNLMSMAEERFQVVRRFLCNSRPDLCTNLNSVDRFMSICKTPCYIPIDGEPMLSDLESHGYDWCRVRYSEIGRKNGNYGALQDFEAIAPFLGLYSQ